MYIERFITFLLYQWRDGWDQTQDLFNNTQKQLTPNYWITDIYTKTDESFTVTANHL
jgi:hypothetical protein